jgi:hypothetical protein
VKDRVDTDEALARLAVPLLQRDGEALRAGCPDANVVAGYLDRTLDAGEVARFEEHFAGCARCQGVLAGLARIETPAPSIQPDASPAGFWNVRVRWQWLAPAAAVLAVGVVWTVVRPMVWSTAPAPVESTVALSKTPAAAGEGQLAVAPEETRKDANQPARSDKDRAPLAELGRPVRMQAESEKPAVAALDARSKREAPVPHAAPPPAIVPNLAVEPPKDVRAGTVPAQKAADAVKPVAAPAPAERVAVFESRAGAARGGAAQIVATSDAISPPPVIVISPSRAVAWRIGSSGSIEQSVDGRRTWQKQDSGVSANLAAGSAPSEATCWIVGQRGTVLRTTDGRTWETVSPPAPVDLVSVSARDGLVATVVAADGRRFATIDGGRTWQTP